VARVAERVSRGGHHVAEATVRQRYQQSVQYFFKLYQPLAQSWRVYTIVQPGRCMPIAFGDSIGKQTVLEDELWRKMQMQAKA
jgi:predicted ABC-type ATPase